MVCWSVGLGDCTAEALRARSKEFLTKRFSELCELWASVVNNSSKETRNNPKGRGRKTEPVMETPTLQPASLLHESLFLGVAGELGAAIDAELLIDVVEMDLDCSLADEEFLADLHIPQPRRHLFDNFDFSGRQYLSGLVSGSLTLKQFFQCAAD